jgi:opacity protein-like surface antigen
MNIRRLAATAASLVLVLAASAARAADEPPKPPDSQPAVAAMTTWLHVIDEGNYGKSWDDASKLFQGALGRERWIDTMNGGRKPLGDLVKRVLKSSTFRKALPGAPDGEYFVIQFNASYSGKADAVETVTAVHEGADWKAAGYFIK